MSVIRVKVNMIKRVLLIIPKDTPKIKEIADILYMRGITFKSNSEDFIIDATNPEFEKVYKWVIKNSKSHIYKREILD